MIVYWISYFDFDKYLHYPLQIICTDLDEPIVIETASQHQIYQQTCRWWRVSWTSPPSSTPSFAFLRPKKQGSGSGFWIEVGSGRILVFKYGQVRFSRFGLIRINIKVFYPSDFISFDKSDNTVLKYQLFWLLYREKKWNANIVW